MVFEKLTHNFTCHCFITGSIVGHVGDGNFHTGLLYDPLNEKEKEIVHALEDKITMYVFDFVCFFNL